MWIWLASLVFAIGTIILVNKISIRNIRCLSLSCGYNYKTNCRCKKKPIIYDNGAIGICLWHTVDMNNRMLDVLKVGMVQGKLLGGINMLDDVSEYLKDTNAITNPKDFEEWMKKHLKEEK